MSTREIAISIIDGMTEEQRRGFILMFGGHISEEKESAEKPNELTSKRAAYLRLKKIIQQSRPMDIEDYDSELAEYREDKYGN